MTHQPNHHMPPCGCPPMQPVAVGEINYSAEQINQLLALIPLKMDRKELHGLISYTSDNYIGHVPDTTSLKPLKAFAWAFVGELSGASPYFHYTPDFIPEGLEEGWNDMSSFFGKYNMTPSKKEDAISAEELFAGYFRLPTLTADKAIADEQGNRIIDTYVKREAVANHIKETYNKQFTENPPLITKGYITPEMLSEETRQMLEATGQDITNLPDGEDLQAVHGVLKFANKEYNPNSYDGLGRQYIRRNIVNGVNTLVQSMVQWSNTLYIIRYDHDLQGRTITIPEGCTLMFESGKLYNGKVVLNDTQVRPYGCLLKDYIDCQIEGTFRKGQVLYSEQYKQTEVWTGKKWKCSYSVLFRVYGNKLQQSLDDGDTWEDVSDYIASYFRFVASDELNSVGKIQISQDNKTWTDLSPEITNYMRIADYVATTAELPKNAPQGLIYGVGPVDGSTYTLYVNTSKGWINNGSFTSFTAGVVQETGDNENAVMSQKAVTEKFNEQEEKLAELGSLLSVLKIEQGGIDSTNGENSKSSIRCRTEIYMYAPFEVSLQSGFESMLFKYGINGEYIESQNWVNSISVADINYKYRIIFRKSDNTNITPEEIVFDEYKGRVESLKNIIDKGFEELGKENQEMNKNIETRLFQQKNVVDVESLDVRPWSLSSNSVNTSYVCTDYIQLKPNTTYSFNKEARICRLYLEKTNFEDRPSTTTVSTENVNTVTTTDTRIYLRLQFSNDVWGDGKLIIVEGDEIPKEYIPYGEDRLKESIIPNLLKETAERSKNNENDINILKESAGLDNSVKIITAIGSSGFDVLCGGQYRLTEKQKEMYGVTNDLTVAKVVQVTLGYDKCNVMAYSGNTASQIFFKNGMACYILKNEVTLKADKSYSDYTFDTSTIQAQMTKSMSEFVNTRIGTINGVINGYNVEISGRYNRIKLLDNVLEDVLIPKNSMLYVKFSPSIIEGSAVERLGISKTTGLILQIGANNEGATPDEIVEYCELAIKMSRCKWFVILRQNTQGDLDYTQSESLGSSDLNKAASLLRKKYGTRFIDHMAYLISKKALQDQGITPTTSERYPDENGVNSNPLTANQISNGVPCDMECIATKQVPSSFWHSAYRDGEEQSTNKGHFNAQGLECLGRYIASFVSDYPR